MWFFHWVWLYSDMVMASHPKLHYFPWNSTNQAASRYPDQPWHAICETTPRVVTMDNGEPTLLHKTHYASKMRVTTPLSGLICPQTGWPIHASIKEWLKQPLLNELTNQSITIQNNPLQLLYWLIILRCAPNVTSQNIRSSSDVVAALGCYGDGKSNNGAWDRSWHPRMASRSGSVLRQYTHW